MNRPSLVINRCGSWGIRTPGTRNCARQFSKLLVSATHPNFQSFGSLTSQHSFSECGCKGKEKNQFHQTFLLFFSKNRCSCMILVDIWTFFAHGFERWLHDDSKQLLCRGGQGWLRAAPCTLVGVRTERMHGTLGGVSTRRHAYRDMKNKG